LAFSDQIFNSPGRKTAKTKHEFRDGKIIDMAGGISDHAGIAMNIGGKLRTRQKGTPCKPYGSDLRVRINDLGNYCYPDVTVACGPLEYDRPTTKTTATNPRVIIEVSSPSTAAEDRGDKFNDYRLIASLEEYLLVSQDRARVEIFYRQSDGIWAIGPAAVGLNQSVKFRYPRFTRAFSSPSSRRRRRLTNPINRLFKKS
jgi:Uma2 family endonuclease